MSDIYNNTGIQNSIHKLNLDELFDKYSSRKDGLTSQEAKDKRNMYGLNTIPPPLSAPAWLCCLLPCLLKTRSMESYNECVPEHGFVRRNKQWVKLDASSIVPGDIVKIEQGERAPADIRVIDLLNSKNVEIDTSDLNGIKQRRIVKLDNNRTDIYSESPNMIFLGSLCTSGECIGLVVATGDDTIIAKLIKRKEWPLKQDN